MTIRRTRKRFATDNRSYVRRDLYFLRLAYKLKRLLPSVFTGPFEPQLSCLNIPGLGMESENLYRVYIFWKNRRRIWQSSIPDDRRMANMADPVLPIWTTLETTVPSQTSFAMEPASPTTAQTGSDEDLGETDVTAANDSRLEVPSRNQLSASPVRIMKIETPDTASHRSRMADIDLTMDDDDGNDTFVPIKDENLKSGGEANSGDEDLSDLEDRREMVGLSIRIRAIKKRKAKRVEVEA